MRTFLQLNGNVVKATLKSDMVPGVGPNLPSDFIEVTSTPLPAGINNWSEVLNYTFSDGVFTPPPTPSKTSRELLKEKTTWTATDRDSAIRELL